MSAANSHVDHLVDDYVHDLLPDADAGRVESHCAACPKCARALEQARRRLALLHTVPPVEPSAGLVRATLDRIESAPARLRLLRKRFWLGVAGVLAASIVVLGSAQLYFSYLLKPGSIDLAVLGQRELLAATTASLRVRLTQRGTTPVAVTMPVIVTLRSLDGRSQVLAEDATDEHGSCAPRLQLPDWPEGNYTLEVKAGKERVEQPVQLKRAWKLMLSSDKPVYQPGQTILLRSLGLRRPDLKPVAGKQAVFTLTDPRGNVLFKHAQPTSKFGIARAECQLAQEIQEGTYTVACDVEGTVSRLSVEVKRYVLPKFKVGVRTSRPYYVPGDKALVTFQGDYFFGKPVAKGQLSYAITSQTGQTVSRGAKLTLDEKGSYRAEFPVPANLVGRENDSGDARLTITAVVTDSAGQKHAGSGEMLVTAHPVRVEAIPESGQLVLGVENTIYLMVRRVDGAPVPGARVSIMGGDVTAEVTTDARGVGSFQVTPTTNEIAWTSAVRDAAGEVLARKNERLAVGVIPGDFLVRLDRAVCKAGEPVTITALGGGIEPVFLDVIKDGQTMLSQVVEVSGGRGELTIDVPPELFGTVQLVAYRFTGSHGLPVRKARVLYITPPDNLRIQATLDQAEYRPGREATIRMRLTDEKGKPTPGAISLAAVDEAVFAVLAQRPGMEQAFYNLEQELLKPVYAIYPWQPEDDVQVAQRDRALFAATARGIDAQPPGNVGPARTPQIPTAGPHTLGVRSLPIKEQRTEALRATGLRWVGAGWAGVALAVWFFTFVGLVTFPTAGTLGKFVQPVGLLVFSGATLVGVGMFLLPHFKMSAPMATGSMAEAMPMEKSEARPPLPNAIDRDGGELIVLDEAQATSVKWRGAPRVRREFPETLLWKPELVTDDDGRLPPLKVQLADSITTWRLSASAVAADGRLGAGQWPMKVFQPFFVDLNLPVSLTRGDEVGMPVVVYNYLDRPQTVTLTLAESPWFTLEGPATRKVELAANEVRSLRFTLKVAKVGTHPLKVTATAGAIGDAIERQVDVVPDGRRVETAYSGGLASAAEHTLTVPADGIEGSVKAFVKVYPSGFSTLLEGLENIFRMPSGCFEQTSSTTYPNVLALDYLRRNKFNLPPVEAKAKQYIHLGYQRLVGFEVPGGGFDWYGNPPANLTLTAYGLMEFADMARVHEVDPRLLERTRAWLMSKRQADGSWAPDLRGGHLAGARDQESARLATTAYVAWSLFASGQSGLLDTMVTLNWLFAHKPTDIKDPHTLALMCNAVVGVDPNSPNAVLRELEPYLDRLAELAKKSDDGKFVYWAQDPGDRTMFYGSGVSGRVETTALAALALLQAKRHPELTRGALAWLVANKDPNGTWHSTQATVLALKAILQGTGEGQGDGKERRLLVEVGKHTEEVVIPADQSEVMRLLDVSKHLAAGENRIRLEEKTKTGASYQVVFRYHVPEAKLPAKEEPLAITLDYDRTELSVGGAVKVKATVVNRQEVTAPMVMLDLPVPPGFAPVAEDFAALVQKKAIARYQALPRGVLVYLRGLEPGAKLELAYTVRATMPVRVASPGGRVYEYYDPQKQGRSPATRFVVRPE
jgi:hypothetical protein